MVGTSIAASVKHHDYGHIDYKLAIWLLAGSIVGAEVGAQILMWLHRMGEIIIHGHSISVMSVCVDIIFIVLLLTVGIVMFIESSEATQREPRGGVVESNNFAKNSKYENTPIISLPVSGINSISIWLILALGFGVGFVVGFIRNRRRICCESSLNLPVRYTDKHRCRHRSFFRLFLPPVTAQ